MSDFDVLSNLFNRDPDYLETSVAEYNFTGTEFPQQKLAYAVMDIIRLFRNLVRTHA